MAKSESPNHIPNSPPKSQKNPIKLISGRLRIFKNFDSLAQIRSPLALGPGVVTKKFTVIRHSEYPDIFVEHTVYRQPHLPR